MGTMRKIPVDPHQTGDRVFSVDAPDLQGTIVTLSPDDAPRPTMTVAWDDGTTTEPPYLRIVNVTRW